MTLQLSPTHAVKISDYTRGGDAVRDVKYEPNHIRPFVGQMHGMTVRWRPDGHFLSEKPSGLDLMMEAADPELIAARNNPNQIGLPL